MKQSKDYFWASYLDLMTSLFAVMLVLFVLSYRMFLDKSEDTERKNRNLEAEKVKLEAEIAKSKLVLKIQNALQLFANADYFKLDNCNRTMLKTNELLFNSNDDKIIETHKLSLENAGRELKRKIDTIVSLDKSVEYVIFIEGTAAKNLNTGGGEGDADFAFNLSYRRSLALLDLWKSIGVITAEKTPSNIHRNRYLLSGQEVLVAGSGYFGYCPDAKEDNNKRFVVQIIPKFKGEQTKNAGSLVGKVRVPSKAETQSTNERNENVEETEKIDLQVFERLYRSTKGEGISITISAIKQNGEFTYTLGGLKQGTATGTINYPQIDFGGELGSGTMQNEKYRCILKLKNYEFTSLKTK
jgi:hypothetical protein